jgi:hypothetical protein
MCAISDEKASVVVDRDPELVARAPGKPRNSDPSHKGNDPHCDREWFAGASRASESEHAPC